MEKVFVDFSSGAIFLLSEVTRNIMTSYHC